MQHEKRTRELLTKYPNGSVFRVKRRLLEGLLRELETSRSDAGEVNLDQDKEIER